MHSEERLTESKPVNQNREPFKLCHLAMTSSFPKGPIRAAPGSDPGPVSPVATALHGVF